MTRFTSPKYLLSVLDSGSTVALTAPLVLNDRVMLGFARSSEESHSVDLALNDFIALCPSLYGRVNTPRVYHGLKRIWEYLDTRGLRTNTERDNLVDKNKIEDIKLMAYLLDPDSGREVESGQYRVQEGLTLAHMCARYLGEEYPYRNTALYETEGPESFAVILAHDAVLIRRLADRLPTLMSPALRKLYRHVELPLMVLLDRMRRTGIGVDGEACREALERIEEEIARLAREITSGAEVDLRSDREVFRFLVAQGVQFRDQRVYQWQRIFAKALEETAPYYPAVQKILEFRDMGYDLAFLRQAEGRDQVHPVWGQTRSATSRIYARNPAVQNVSRELRNLFVPAPGHVLIKADYSQAQMRIIAHLSQDPELTKIFNDPSGDVHAETSKRLGLNDRNVAKEINFAICFGMGPAALCRKINDLKDRQDAEDFIDEPKAESYIDGFYDRFPKVKEFFDREWKKLTKLPAQDRVVRSLTGRERRFPRRATAEVDRQFRVTWPQQIEADLIKAAMLRLDRIFRRRNVKARIVMMIHDALWVEAPNEEENEVRRLVRRMMSTAGKLDVPLKVDFE
jgi:DNA polymerase I